MNALHFGKLKVKLVKQADKKCISDREGLICEVGFCFVFKQV